MKLIGVVAFFSLISGALTLWIRKDTAVDVDVVVAPSEMDLWNCWLWTLSTAIVATLTLVVAWMFCGLVLRAIRLAGKAWVNRNGGRAIRLSPAAARGRRFLRAGSVFQVVAEIEDGETGPIAVRGVGAGAF